eukprot:scaffold5627_cov36-Phaeocystis_antarctica.AAC.1
MGFTEDASEGKVRPCHSPGPSHNPTSPTLAPTPTRSPTRSPTTHWCITYGCRVRHLWLQVRFYREVELKHCRVGMLAAIL